MNAYSAFQYRDSDFIPEENTRNHNRYLKRTIYPAIGFSALLLVVAIIAFLVVWFTRRSDLPECGVIPDKQSEFIVNGTEVKTDEFPFYVSIKYRHVRLPHCGGSIIAPKWVLTAKHCVYTDEVIKICDKTSTKPKVDCFQVVAGSRDSLNTSEGTVHDVVDIVTISPHTSHIIQEDIALLFVSPPFQYKPHTNSSRGIVSVCLPEKNDKVTEKQADLVGFGTISEFHHIPATKLMTAKIDNLNIDECLRLYMKDVKLYEIPEDFKRRLLCAGIAEESKGACYGDSGGPLSVKRKSKAIQIGVANSVALTGCGDKYTLFTSIMYYRDWIQKITDI